MQPLIPQTEVDDDANKQHVNWTARGLRTQKNPETSKSISNSQTELTKKTATPFFEKFCERKETTTKEALAQEVALSSGTLVNFMKKK